MVTPTEQALYNLENGIAGKDSSIPAVPITNNPAPVKGVGPFQDYMAQHPAPVQQAPVNQSVTPAPNQTGGLGNIAKVTEAVASPGMIGGPADTYNLLRHGAGGVAMGFQNLIDSSVALGALGADVVGATGARDSLIQSVITRDKEAARVAAGFTSWQDVKDAKGYWPTKQAFEQWALSTTGQFLPQVGAVMTGAGTAAVIGKALATKAITARAASMAGAYLVASALETGGITQEQITSGNQINPTVAIVAGMAMGALESVTPLGLGKAAGFFGKSSAELSAALAAGVQEVSKYPAHMLAKMLKGGMVEGATEVSQEAIAITARSYIDEKYSWASPDVKSRLEESFVSALVGGGVLTAGAHAIGSRRFNRKQEVPPVEPTSTTTPTAEGGASIGPSRNASSLSSSKVKITLATPTINLNPADTQVIEKGSVLADLLKVNSPNLTPLAGDSGLLPSIAIADKKDAGRTAKFLHFENPDRAFFTSAEKTSGGDPRNQVFIKSDKGILTQDVSAPLHMIPSGVTLADPNVSFVGDPSPAAKESLLQDLNLAVSVQNKGVYEKALSKGIRYKTDGSQGFVAINPAQGGNLHLADAPLSPLLAEDTLVVEAKIGAGVKAGQATTFTSFDGAQQASSFNISNKQPHIVFKDSLDKSKITAKELADVQTSYSGIVQGINFKQFQDGVAQLHLDGGTIVRPKGMTWSTLYRALSPLTYNALVKKGLRITLPNMTPEQTMYLGTLSGKQLHPLIKPDANLDTQPNPTSTDFALFQFDLLHEGLTTDFQDKNGNTIVVDLPGKGETTLLELQNKGPGVQVVKDIGARENPTRRNKRFMKVAETILTSLQKTFMFDGAFVLAFTTEVVPSDLSEAFHVGYDPEGLRHIININLSLIPLGHSGLSKSSFSSVTHLALLLGHEFGHALSTRYLSSTNKINSGLLAEVLTAYHRWVQRAGLLSSATTLSESFGVHRGLVVFEGLPVTTKPLTTQITLGSGYLFNFEEFFAEQSVMYLQANSQILTHTDTFFSWFAHTMVKVYKKINFILGATGGSFPEPSSAFTELMSYAKTRDPKYSSLNHLTDIRNGARVWNERLGVHVDKASPSLVIKASKSLLGKLDKGVLGKKDQNGRTVGENLKDIAEATDYYNSVVKWGWTVAQLAWKNPTISFLQKYVTKVNLWAKEKSYWQSIANDTLRSWGSLGKDQSDRVSKYLFALDAMFYLGDKEKARHPTDLEREELIKIYKLNEAGLKVAEQVLGDFQAMLNRLEEVAIKQLADVMDVTGAAYQVEVATIKNDFNKLREKPYFPHARFGNRAIVITDADGKTVYMEQVETGWLGVLASVRGTTPRKLERLRAEIVRDLKPGEKAAIVAIPESVQVYQGMPPAVIQRIRSTLHDSLSDEQKDWLQKLSIEYAPTQSFRKRLKRRANTPGFSKDAMRSYANYFWHGSNHLARISYGHELTRVLEAFKKDNSARAKEGDNVELRGKMVDHLEDHHKAIMNPKPDWAQLRSIAFIWWLGFSPASAVLNFTQIPLTTVPYLSARFGDVKALAAIGKAGMRLRKMYMNPDEMKAKWNVDDARLIELGLQDGILEESLAMELAGTAEGYNLLGARHGGALQRSMAGFAHASGWMFQASEKINRRITFNAAISLARAHPEAAYLQELRVMKMELYNNLIAVEKLSPVEATAYLAGKDAIARTQFEYGAHAKPRFMRGKKGVIFTFYMFLQNMLWAVGNSPGNKRMLLTMLLMSGFMGLPGADDIAEVVEFIGRKLFGERYNVQEEIAKLVQELGGDAYDSDLLLHGAGRVGFGLPALGDLLGLPIPSFDMSNSVGMGNIVPGLATALNNDKGSFEQTLGKMTTDIAGASLGIGINMMKFLNDTQLPIDDMKRWERAMPRAMKNVVKSMRYVPPDSALSVLTGNFVQPEGRERTRTGSTVVAFEGDNPEHMMEIAMQAAGFQITRVSREWNDIIARSEVVDYWRLRRGMLITQYWHTLYTKDPDARRTVYASIKKFNKTIPFKEMSISNKTLRESKKARRKRMLQQQQGVESSKMFRRLARDTGKLYPSKIDETIISSEIVK